MPGLFSGISAESEQALSAARQGAADRGDFEAVERSYLTTPDQKADYAAGKAEKAILKRLPRLPAAELTKALAGLTDFRTARTGAIPETPSLDQIKAGRAGQLIAGQPAGDADKLLFGDRSSTNKPQLFHQDGPLGEDGLPGPQQPYYWDAANPGQASPVDLTGGKQAQGQAPADYPDAYQGLKPDGTPGWFVKRNGKTLLISQ